MRNERIKVLYVDDEEANLKAFKATFRRDMDVYLALSADEALTFLAGNTVHVIISDQRMPNMTGSEFLAVARERHPRTMRMLLTGYSDIDAVIEAINKGGIYAYATKPWDPNDLKLRIEQAYEVYALRDDREQLLQRYSQVFEASGDPIVILDEQGRIHDANPATGRLFGAEKGAILNSPFAEHLSDPTVLEKSLAALREGQPTAGADMVFKTQKGRLIDSLVTITRLNDPTTAPALFQAMIKDISDRKQEEVRLRKLNEDLDRRVAVRTRQLLDALEDLGSFSYTVAHDLRSPLKNILALSQHLDELSRELNSEQAESAQRIHRGAERMLQLVDDLLRFSQTNTREVQRSGVTLGDLFRRCIDDHVPEELRGNIQVKVDPTVTLEVDPTMLNVALGNLLSNAIKYSRNTTSPVIELGHRIQGEQHLIWVKDNGVGFDSNKSDQVFTAFKRLHRTDQFEGTGVGLAIVQRIVSKHGGRAYAESEPGKGTTITLSLPVNPVIEHALPFAS